MTLPVEALAFKLAAVALLMETLPVEALASISPVTWLLSLMLPVLAVALTLVNVNSLATSKLPVEET